MMPFRQLPLTAVRNLSISLMEAGAAALPYTAELTPDAVAMWTFFLNGRAILPVLLSRSMA
eukprot:13122190-Heterocapsa_arctica.AAC.1